MYIFLIEICGYIFVCTLLWVHAIDSCFKEQVIFKIQTQTNLNTFLFLDHY